MNRQLTKYTAAAVSIALVAAIAVVLLVGRGGGGATAAAAQGPGNGAAPASGNGDFQQFAECLRSHGVTLTPGTRPDFGSTKVQQALEACRQYRPSPPSGRNRPQGPPPTGALPNGTPSPRSIAPSTQNGQTAPTT